MLYLSSFFGRTVTHITAENQHVVFRFMDFSMIFLAGLESHVSPLDHFVGEKFLYIQRHSENVFFHFSNSLHFSVRIEVETIGVPQYIMLRNKNQELLLRLADGKTFDGL